MNCGIIVRILCDARMVAPGVVLERGDRICSHRIRRSFSSLALNEAGAADYFVRCFRAIRSTAVMHLLSRSGRLPVKVTLCGGLFGSLRRHFCRGGFTGNTARSELLSLEIVFRK